MLRKVQGSVKLLARLLGTRAMMACKGLQMLMYARCYLGQPIVQLIGNMMPLFFKEFGSLALDDVLKHHQAITGLPILIMNHCGCEISPERFVVLPQIPFLYFIA